jgi:dipeptidyl-peptidase-4
MLVPLARSARQLVLLAALIASAAPAPLGAQRTDSALTVQRIFASPEFFAQGFRGARWRPGMDAYTRLERSASNPDWRDLVQYDAESGQRTVVLPAARLIPRGETTPIEVDDYTCFNDG